MDSVSAGLISACCNYKNFPYYQSLNSLRGIVKTPLEKPEPSDYVATLLRDSTSSHLLEKLVTLVPDLAFNVLWEQYFQG